MTTSNFSKLRAIFVLLVFTLLGFVIGVLVNITSSKRNVFDETRLPQQYEFINPLLECDSSIGDYKSLTKAEAGVSEYIQTSKLEGKISSASIYYRDLNNGPWFGVNEHEKFTPASLIKVPMMISYYKKAEVNPSILQKKIRYVSNKVSSVPVFITPNKDLVDGNEYTINELVEYMIKYSSNSAYSLLKQDLGISDFEQTLRDFGLDVDSINSSNTENVLTIKQYSSFFRILYNSSYLSRDYSEKALRLLSEVDFKGGIRGGVPTDVVVSDKFGERSYPEISLKQLHDCGVVYKTNNPYLVCIMTRGENFSELLKSLKDISSIIYNSID